jgi:hypothetical protein
MPPAPFPAPRDTFAGHAVRFARIAVPAVNAALIGIFSAAQHPRPGVAADAATLAATASQDLATL